MKRRFALAVLLAALVWVLVLMVTAPVRELPPVPFTPATAGEPVPYVEEP